MQRRGAAQQQLVQQHIHHKFTQSTFDCQRAKSPPRYSHLPDRRCPLPSFRGAGPGPPLPRSGKVYCNNFFSPVVWFPLFSVICHGPGKKGREEKECVGGGKVVAAAAGTLSLSTDDDVIGDVVMSKVGNVGGRWSGEPSAKGTRPRTCIY